MILFREPAETDPSNPAELKDKSLNDDTSIKAREGTSMLFFQF